VEEGGKSSCSQRNRTFFDEQLAAGWSPAYTGELSLVTDWPSQAGNSDGLRYSFLNTIVFHGLHSEPAASCTSSSNSVGKQLSTLAVATTAKALAHLMHSVSCHVRYCLCSGLEKGEELRFHAFDRDLLL
jgi:hypothetical protein